MKKLLFSLLLILACIVNGVPGAMAQNSFAPVGAEWYHDMGFGVFHSVVTGDTVLNGITCRHISVRPLIKNPERAPSPISSYNFYVYDNTDTVFIYNNLFERFTPLYVFNVQAGDTLHLPVPPLYSCERMLETDSLFMIEIDSVVTKNWDNVPLKTVYSHPVERQLPYAYFSYGDSGYAQSLGSIATGFLPECLNCAGLLSESCQSMHTLRCYHEAIPGGMSVTLVDTCDNNANTGISTVEISADFKLYPNPVHQSLGISYGHLQSPVREIEIFDVLGRKVFTRGLSRYNNTQPLQVDVSEWSPGIYLVKLKTPTETIAAAKFVKE